MTKDGKRRYASSCLRDQCGAVDVEVVGDAMPALHGCAGAEAVTRALASGTLQPKLNRVNASEFLKNTETGRKTYVCAITDTMLNVAATARRSSLGFSEVSGDIAVAVPA